MSGVKKTFLFLTMVVFAIDVVLVILLIKANKEDDEPIINVPSYDEPVTTLLEIPTKETSSVSLWEPDDPDKGLIINIEYYNQDNFPTFCEGVTTLMSLRYMGYNITIDDLIEKYVPSYNVTKVDGKYVGEHPDTYFIGDPRSKGAYGCYAPVIEKALVEIAGRDAVHNLTGMDIDEIIARYVNKGIPVIFWATIGMSQITQGNSWYIERTGETFTWKGGEHCLLLAGSDENNYYFYDPWDNNGIISYDKAVVKDRYEKMGKMAVALVKRGDE